MKALFEAIDGHYEAAPDSLLAQALGEDFWEGEAPQGTEVPYGVFSLVTDPTTYNFTSTFEHPRIQFDLYETDTTRANELFEALKDLFDGARLAVAGFHLIDWERTFAQKVKAGHAWRWIVEYRAHLQKE